MRALVAFLLVLIILPAHRVIAEEASETSTQLWVNFMLGRPVNDQFYVEYDIEAAGAIDEAEPWKYLYGTGLAEYYPNQWVDLTGELVTGVTKQTSAEDSAELATRLGIRLHLVRQIFATGFLNKYRPERFSEKRFTIANLARLEFRKFWYTGDRDDETEVRFRNRLETKFALNESNLNSDGVIYLLADVEFFVPLSDEEVAERFATTRRLRLGLGYRFSYKWRFETLYMQDNAKDTIESDINVDARMIDLRFRRFF